MTLFPQQSGSPHKENGKTSPSSTSLQQNLIILYTGLAILKQMRCRLGLEAMLEYMDRYTRLLEKRSPGIKQAAWKAIRLMDIETMYSEVCGNDDKDDQ